MAAPERRNIGAEILEGLRQLKRGEHGRVTTVPSVATIREGTGLSQPRLIAFDADTGKVHFLYA
jgi:hypothetical protein